MTSFNIKSCPDNVGMECFMLRRKAAVSKISLWPLTTTGEVVFVISSDAKAVAWLHAF
jgi:hypothetical protein